MRRVATLLAAGLLLAACTAGDGSSRSPRSLRTSVPVPPTGSGTLAQASPAASLPPFYLESLRARQPVAGQIRVGMEMWRGSGFAKFQMSWTSDGQPMTGTISIPEGPGPFPVVIVNHGHIPPERYWIGQDSGIFGDPMAEHGYLSLAPNYVGYEGSGPGADGLLTNQRIAVSEMDLISSLGSLPQAGHGGVALVGHSQGGGVSEILMVVDPRVRALVLHAPVSSDETENALRTHARSGTWPALGDPGQKPEAYAHVSPRNYLAAWQPPVLLIQGSLDQTIPAAHTQATFEALQRAGVAARLIWIPGGDHDLVGGDLARAVAAQEDWIRAAPEPGAGP